MTGSSIIFPHQLQSQVYYRQTSKTQEWGKGKCWKLFWENIKITTSFSNQERISRSEKLNEYVAADCNVPR
jgi:hypothetical protein